MSTPAKYIKMTIRLKDGRKVVAYFENIEQLTMFADVIKDLGEAVEVKTRENFDK